MEVADHQDVEAEAIREHIAGPSPEDSRHDDDGQAPAGVAPDEHEERCVEDADEDAEDEGGADAHEPAPTATGPVTSG